MGKWHRDHELFDFTYTRQQGPRENTVVRAHTTNQLGQNHPVHQAMRMVRNNNHRTRFGDMRDLFIRCLKLNTHMKQSLRPERLPVRSAIAFKTTHQADQRDLSGEPFHHANGVGLPRICKRVGIRKLTLVVGRRFACSGDRRRHNCGFLHSFDHSFCQLLVVSFAENDTLPLIVFAELVRDQRFQCVRKCSCIWARGFYVDTCSFGSCQH